MTNNGFVPAAEQVHYSDLPLETKQKLVLAYYPPAGVDRLTARDLALPVGISTQDLYNLATSARKGHIPGIVVDDVDGVSFARRTYAMPTEPVEEAEIVEEPAPAVAPNFQMRIQRINELTTTIKRLWNERQAEYVALHDDPEFRAVQEAIGTIENLKRAGEL